MSQRIHKVVEADATASSVQVQVRHDAGGGARLPARRRAWREVAEFFSFGTNDLTQATFSFSREDAENKFLPAYNETGILQDNPFEVLDIKGVGQLMKMAVDSGPRDAARISRSASAASTAAIPTSIHFCHHDRPQLRVVLRPARADRAARGGAGQAEGKGIRTDDGGLIVIVTVATNRRRHRARESAP